MEKWVKIDWISDVNPEAYSVSNQGRVRRNNYSTETIMRGKKSVFKYKERPMSTFVKATESRGYKGKERVYVKLGKKQLFLHRIIGRAFVPGYFEGACINHLDGDPLNNDVSNLEWCTHKENLQHAWDNGFCTPRRSKK